MSVLLPIIVTASHIVLAADRVPEFNVDPGCQVAAATDVRPNHDPAACKRDELGAHSKLEGDWAQYTAAQKARCVALSQLGGNPSYVELLTCLELAKAAKALPPADRMTGQGSGD